MTRKQSLLRVVVAARLKQADVHLRAAMIAAGDIGMTLVTNDIRDAQFSLDDALTRVELVGKEKLKKNLTNARDGL